MNDDIKRKILALLDQHRIMTVATLRPDDSQKAKNLARDNPLALTIDHDTSDLMAITGLSMAAHAQAVTDRAEAEKVLRMLPLQYPEAKPLPMKMPAPDEVRIFRITPSVISVLDYTQGFGHTDLVTC